MPPCLKKLVRTAASTRQSSWRSARSSASDVTRESDAMTSSRAYQPALPIDFAISEILRNSGTQFDPAVVDIFIELAARMPRSVKDCGCTAPLSISSHVHGADTGAPGFARTIRSTNPRRSEPSWRQHGRIYDGPDAGHPPHNRHLQ